MGESLAEHRARLRFRRQALTDRWEAGKADIEQAKESLARAMAELDSLTNEVASLQEEEAALAWESGGNA